MNSSCEGALSSKLSFKLYNIDEILTHNGELNRSKLKQLIKCCVPIGRSTESNAFDWLKFKLALEKANLIDFAKTGKISEAA